MEKFIVDRIADGIAVLEKEDRNHIQVPVSDIVFEIKEGSVLLFDGERYFSDESEEKARRKKLFAMQERLKQK